MAEEAPVMSPSQILSEPVRIYLIELLCTGAMTSGDLATMCFARFRIGWSSVSRQLARLVAAEFVRCVHERAERWYALEPDWLERASADILRLDASWRAGASDRALGFCGELYDEGRRGRPVAGAADESPDPAPTT